MLDLRNDVIWARPEDDGSGKEFSGKYDPVDCDYRHASKETIEQYLHLKFGIRIHFGVYQLINNTGGLASWHLYFNTGGATAWHKKYKSTAAEATDKSKE